MYEFSTGPGHQLYFNSLTLSDRIDNKAGFPWALYFTLTVFYLWRYTIIFFWARYEKHTEHSLEIPIPYLVAMSIKNVYKYKS